LPPQYSDFDTGTIAVFRATKHKRAKTNPTINVDIFFLTAPYIRLIIPVFNINMPVIY
jgi:hypothetical protein